MLKTCSFFVPDIRCVNCHQLIKNALKSVDELNIDSIDIDEKEVSIRVPEGIHPDVLQQRITSVLQSIGHHPVFSDESFQEQSSEQTAQHWLYGLVGSVSGFAFMILCLIVGPMSFGLTLTLTFVSGVLTIMLGAASYQRALMEWGHAKQLSMDSLFAVSTIIVLIMSVVSLFVPGFPMMLDTGLLIFGFRHLGLAIERSLIRNMQINTRFVDRLPQTVRVGSVEDDFEVKLLRDVKPGERIELQPGEIIPLDGECLNEQQDIYDDIMTGSYLPRHILRGEKLFSGMRVAEGGAPMWLLVTQSLETSYLKRRDQLNAKTRFENQARFEVIATTLVHYFIPTVLVLAILSGGLLACFFPWTIAIRCAIAVLVSACPCTLGLVVPLAVKIGIKKASDHGVQFRSKEQLQRAGEVDCVVFDLNGTLTLGVPEVAGDLIWDQERISQDACIRAIAALEKNSKHPHGQALYQYVKDKALSVPKVDVQRHYAGVSAIIDQDEYLIGNDQMMAEYHIDVQDYQQRSSRLTAGDRVIYLVRSRQVVAHLVLRDPLRPEARQMVDALKTLGKTVFICTGDELETAKGYAEQLDIPVRHIRARQRCSLHGGAEDDKSRFIQSLTDQGYCVAMVGDAGNDVNAISASYFGLALRSAGSDEVTMAKAGAVIDGSSLLPVMSAFAVSQQTVRHIKQNLFMSLGYNMIVELLMVGLLLGFGMVLHPGVGVVLMILQMCLVLGNAYRFQREPLLNTDLLPQVVNDVEQPVQNGLTHLPQSHLELPSVVSTLWRQPPSVNELPLSQHSPHSLSREVLQPERLANSL